jgi:uncharacterized protein (TIGR02246 family)
MKLAFWIPLAIFLAAGSLCASTNKTPTLTSEPGAREKVPTEIRAVYMRWKVAADAHDIEKVMSVFDRNMILSYQGTDDVGYDELKQGYARDFKSDPPGAQWLVLPQEAHLEGNMAVAISIWELQVPSDHGVKIAQRIRSVDVLRRKEGGWKIIRTVNYPETI